jgi:hypothetical protein
VFANSYDWCVPYYLDQTVKEASVESLTMEKRVGVLRGVFNTLIRLCVVHMFMSAIHLHNIMHDTRVLLPRYVIAVCMRAGAFRSLHSKLKDREREALESVRAGVRLCVSSCYYYICICIYVYIYIYI